MQLLAINNNNQFLALHNFHKFHQNQILPPNQNIIIIIIIHSCRKHAEAENPRELQLVRKNRYNYLWFKVAAGTSGKIKFITLAADLGHLNLFALNIGSTWNVIMRLIWWHVNWKKSGRAKLQIYFEVFLLTTRFVVVCVIEFSVYEMCMVYVL